MAFDTLTKTFTGIPSAAINCWCGVTFAIPRSLYDHYVGQNDRKAGSYSIHCPLGHSMIPAGRSEAARLRDELAREKSRTDQAKANAAFWVDRAREVGEKKAAVERSLRATKAVVTRTKKKIAAGRCPCCTRKFRDLAEHMKVEHPKYDPDKHVAALEAKEQG